MAMVHIRAVSPPGLTAEVLALLTDDPGVLDLVVQPGAARNPDGDTMVCDVLTGAANRVLRGLRDLRLDQRGSVVVDPVGMAFSARADDAAKQLGSMARAPVWEEVDARIRAEGTYAPSFYLHLVVAGLIASVGIVTNSQILIVAAMVVGPEYGAIVSIALGVDRRDRTRIREGAFALGAGFLLAITVTFVDWLAGLSAGKRESRPWIVSDELWGLVEPLPTLPEPGPKLKPGRPRVPDRQALCGILFVLHTGIQWEYLPQELGFDSGMTCWRRLAAWNEAGVWDRLHLVLLRELRAARQLDWSGR